MLNILMSDVITSEMGGPPCWWDKHLSVDMRPVPSSLKMEALCSSMYQPTTLHGVWIQDTTVWPEDWSDMSHFMTVYWRLIDTTETLSSTA